MFFFNAYSIKLESSAAESIELSKCGHVIQWLDRTFELKKETLHFLQAKYVEVSKAKVRGRKHLTNAYIHTYIHIPHTSIHTHTHRSMYTDRHWRIADLSTLKH